MIWRSVFHKNHDTILTANDSFHLTDDVLGRTLDALYEADVSALYQVIAERVVDKLGLTTDSVHLDITSFHVDGELCTR